ncbi:MAG: glycine cleavage system aminomethyltransferase GcvT [Pseudomonadota bacterium]
MSPELKHTPLLGAHQASGAKLVSFCGWEMPVQYSGIVDEHRTVRSAVGVFDVSHMGEIVLRGSRAGEATQRLVTAAVLALTDGAAVYTLMCYPDGGIVDDCIVYRRTATDYLIIVNASNIDKDWAWAVENVGSTCTLTNESDETALIAVQGPRAVELVARLAGRPLAAEVPSFHHTQAVIAGVRCMAARTGYTGEDGFEIACPNDGANRLWDALFEAGREYGIKPAGLGARDTLRLEAKLCLYGNDIDQTTTPLEAGLGWAVKLDGEDFLGRQALIAQKAAGTKRQLVGFLVKGRGIARHGYSILENEEGGVEIGKVTSGTTAPHLGIAVGMGYVPTRLSKPGTRLAVDCRGKVVPIEIHKGPFYKRSQG